MNEILIDTSDAVMTITLNRVEKKNSISRPMYTAMADALARAEADRAVRVVVFQGHETIFSAGNDIADFLDAPGANQESPVWRFLGAITTFPKPIVAAVCGPAVGIGTTMLLHCDLVYAGDNAAFSMPFVNLGVCPEAASSLLVPQMMGYQRAAQALLLGEPFLAEAAMDESREEELTRELKDVLGKAIDMLPERERQLIAFYYQEDLTLREISRIFGLGEPRVCQLHAQAVLRLKGKINRHFR